MVKVVFFNERGKKLVSKLILVTLFLISSCTKEDIKVPGDFSQENKEVEAIFRSAISRAERQSSATRASGTIWDSGDAIGVFAVNQSETPDIYTIYNEKGNIKYITNLSGSIANFLAADEAITFPVTKEQLDFIAYYPYTSRGIIGGSGSEGGSETGSDLSLQIDISQQLPHSNIDLMYARSTSHNIDNPEVGLTFTHSLSQLVMELTADENISLEGAGVTIHNAITQGNMNLEDGTVYLAETISGEIITPLTVYNSAENSIIATAIILPGQDLSGTEVHIQTADGSTYNWQPDEYQLLPGVRRSYRLNLTPHSIEIKVTGSAISDWQDDPVVLIEDISPVGVIGNGTKESPYTVAQAIINQGQTEVWVEGYIMGWGKGSLNLEVLTTTTDSNSATNIVLADNNTEIDTSKMIPIKFSTVENDPQKQLNLKDNNHLLGIKVKVCCNLSKEYSVPGGNEIIGFELT